MDLLKSLLHDPNNIAPSHFAIITNNLSTILLRKKDFIKAYKYSEMGLFKLEPIIFKQMKDTSSHQRTFNKDLMILLQGYLNYAKCLAILQAIQDKIQDVGLKNQILNKNPMTFYKNGHKLSCKYLGQESYLAKKFMSFINHGPGKINPLKLETLEDAPNAPIDVMSKTNKSSDFHQKKGFQLNEVIESATQEESFDKMFDEPTSHKKDFRIKNKTHHRNYKSQIEFGNSATLNHYNDREYYEIVDKMRDMEENLRKIQELRERYKFEKQMIENDYNYIKNKSLEYFNSQPRIPGPYNTWNMTNTPNNFMNNKPLFSNTFDNYWHQQTNMMDPSGGGAFHQSSVSVSPNMVNNLNFNNPASNSFFFSFCF